MIEKAFMLSSDLFEVTTPGPHFINPICFGEDFARYLSRHLSQSNITPSEPIQEDFGWVLMLPFRGHTFTLTIGVMEESIGVVPAQWRVGIAFEKPFNRFASWFKRPPHEDLSALAEIVKVIITTEPRITGVQQELELP